MSNVQESRFWFVLRTSSRSEKKVKERIENLGMEIYLPLMTTVRHWSDRKKKVYAPLIPCTMFIYCLKDDLKKLYHIQGFHSILHYLGKPAIVRDIEIRNLKILLQENVEFEREEFQKIEAGDKVEVISGPFQGLIATSLEVGRRNKLIVQIESIEQRFVIHVLKSFVRKLN